MTTLNKEQKEIIKTINQAYNKLAFLDNITWTTYRQNLFMMHKKDEIKHRSTSRDYEASMNDCARLFTVKWIANAIINRGSIQIKSLIHIRQGCYISASLVENYFNEFVEAWQDEDIKKLSELDYMSLVNFETYIKYKKEEVV